VLDSQVPKVRIPHICEHDIDLLLLEEFVASPDFLSWFSEQVGIRETVELQLAACSVATPTGESDLELHVIVGTKWAGYLIENKLAAPLQERQAERYHERAESYISKGRCEGCITVIVGPRDYFGGKNKKLGFDYRIDLEDILAWFENHYKLENRKQYIVPLLRTAIDQGCMGWTLVPDPAVTAFWQEYWEMASKLAPELRLPKPSEKPATSNFIYFRPLGLPKNTCLVHKVNYGYIDLQFGSMGEKTAELKKKYGRRLETGMRIDQAGKSGVIRIQVPAVDVRKPFTASESSIRKALQEATRLMRWFKRGKITCQPV